MADGGPPKGSFYMYLVFVCTGNICRSPMAEGMFKKLLKEKGDSGIVCSSAGLSTVDGRHASENAQTVALEYGVDISAHRSHLLTRSISRRADMIVCMTQEHFDMLNRLIPEEKLAILGGGIDDPYGGDIEVYRRCAAEIDAALPELYEKIKCKG